MPIRPLSMEQLEAAQAGLRDHLAKQAASAPDVVNLDHAVALFEPIPLLWGETEYRVRHLGYQDALRLEKARLRFDAWKDRLPQSEKEIDERAEYIADLVGFMHGLLDPKPPTNPFANASPWEVGHLAGFFYQCQTMQREHSRLRPASVSRSTTSMPWPSSSGRSRHG